MRTKRRTKRYGSPHARHPADDQTEAVGFARLGWDRDDGGVVDGEERRLRCSGRPATRRRRRRAVGILRPTCAAQQHLPQPRARVVRTGGGKTSTEGVTPVGVGSMAFCRTKRRLRGRVMMGPARSLAAALMFNAPFDGGFRQHAQRFGLGDRCRHG